MGGSFQRYLLNSTLHHLLKPLVQKEHYHVDYFLLLTTSAAPPAYRADLPYMNHLQWDPIFGTQIPSKDEIGTRIRNLIQECTNTASHGRCRFTISHEGFATRSHATNGEWKSKHTQLVLWTTTLVGGLGGYRKVTWHTVQSCHDSTRRYTVVARFQYEQAVATEGGCICIIV